MKAKKQKLLFKPTSISRLRHYRSPIKMVGDPPWKSGSWADRARVVYAYEMDRKTWPMAWDPYTWTVAHNDNENLNYLISLKWDDYEYAWEEHRFLSHEEAERDNAAWDYHHEHFMAA